MGETLLSIRFHIFASHPLLNMLTRQELRRKDIPVLVVRRAERVGEHVPSTDKVEYTVDSVLAGG